MSENTKPTVTPPDLKGGGANKGAPQDKENENRSDKNRVLPIVALGTITALAIGTLVFLGMNNDPEEPVNPQQTTSAPAVPGESANPGSSGNQQTTPQVTPGGGKEIADAKVEKSEVEKAAENFMKQISSGKSGQAWADDMKTMVTTPFYESLKHADPESVPAGDKVTVTGENGRWTGTVVNAEGATLYTFAMGGYAKQIDGYNAPDEEGFVLVENMTLPERERELDTDGHPIKPPVAPLSPQTIEGLETQTYYVAKAYFEFKKGDSAQDRMATVKRMVNDGEVPDLRPVVDGQDIDVQMYAPVRVKQLNESIGEESKEGFITVSMSIQYADAAKAEPRPLEEVVIGVDFAWDDASSTWHPAGFRVLSARPLTSSGG